MELYKDNTDDELVEMYIAGDNTAFDVLLSRYTESVYAYILRVVKNETLSQDLFQEVFIKVIVSLKRGMYKCDGKFTSWLMRIVHNMMMEVFRVEKRATVLLNGDYEANLFDLCTELDGNIEDNIVDAQIFDELHYLITKLPEDQQQIVDLRYYKGKSFKEIADMLDISINTALGRMRYAITNLRKMAKKRDMLYKV